MDNYAAWYQTSAGLNSGRKTINLRAEDLSSALTLAQQALGDAGWTLTSMREYNALDDKTGYAFIYDLVLSVNTTDVPE